MAGFIPLGDASRRPRQFAVVTFLIILLNAFAFLQELSFGDRFVYAWSTIPIYVVHGRGWITPGFVRWVSGREYGGRVLGGVHGRQLLP